MLTDLLILYFRLKYNRLNDVKMLSKSRGISFKFILSVHLHIVKVTNFVYVLILTSNHYQMTSMFFRLYLYLFIVTIILRVLRVDRPDRRLENYTKFKEETDPLGIFSCV